MNRFGLSRLLVTVGAAVLLALACDGCSSKAALVAKGSACELASDCQGGLYCYKSVCTDDATGAQQLPPTPDAGGAAPPGPVSDAGSAADAPSAAEASAPVSDAAGD